MTTLIFVRHGHSESNLRGTFTGQREAELTEIGRIQAENAAEYLKDYPITAVYSSDLRRAMDTAAPTAKMHGLKVIPEPDLREINAGLWEGKNGVKLLEEFPDTYPIWVSDVGKAHPDGGESTVQLAERVNNAINRIVKRHPGECIAVFSHATPLRVMGCVWYGYPIEDAGLIPWSGNASVSIAEYEDDGSFRLILYGYDEYQGDLATKLSKAL